MPKKTTKKKRRTKYQKAGPGMKKFAVKPGVYYSWSPVKNFNKKSKAQAWVKSDKKGRKSARHRVVKNPNKRKKPESKFTVYRTFFP